MRSFKKYHGNWSEVSLWQEFLSMFKNNDDWRYVIRLINSKYAFRYHGPEHRFTNWHTVIERASQYLSYGDAKKVADEIKKVNPGKVDVIIVKPIT